MCAFVESCFCFVFVVIVVPIVVRFIQFIWQLKQWWLKKKKKTRTRTFDSVTNQIAYLYYSLSVSLWSLSIIQCHFFRWIHSRFAVFFSRIMYYFFSTEKWKLSTTTTICEWIWNTHTHKRKKELAQEAIGHVFYIASQSKIKSKLKLFEFEIRIVDEQKKRINHI